MNDRTEKVRLLIVDDETDFIQALAKSLGRRGFDVHPASSGEEALELLGRMHFDVAVLDMKMPGMDGETLFDRMRMCWPTIPVIMLTGHGNVQQAFRTSREGIFDYIAKPCEVDLLARVARQAVEHVWGSPASCVEDMREEIRVLVVDDDEDLLSSLGKALGRRGFVVSIARDGEEALLRTAQDVYDVVVLDLRMPGMGGLDVLRCMKSQAPNTEILLLTGHASVSTAFEGIRLGAFDYMLKPYDMDELVTKLRSAHTKRLNVKGAGINGKKVG